MIPHIIKIINLREEFFRNINLWISNIYQAVSDSNTKIEIVYKKCCNQEEVKEKLFNSKEKDNFYHYATFGPHHDDYYFKFNDDELNSVASQGQKRMVFISFKFALIKYIQLITNTTPVILLPEYVLNFLLLTIEHFEMYSSNELYLFQVFSVKLPYSY